MSGLCECGCGNPAPIAKSSWASRGWVKGQPKRFISGHNGAKSPIKYIVDPATGCWVWQRATTGAGYGSLFSGGRCRPAHRVMYEQARGPIPDGLFLDHLCRNPACVNPDHLEPVTCAVNNQRGLAARLTSAQVQEIRDASGVTNTAIAAMYGMTKAQIGKIRSGKAWRTEGTR